MTKGGGAFPMRIPLTLIPMAEGEGFEPRYGFPYSGFQDRLFQPLTHPSAGVQQAHAVSG